MRAIVLHEFGPPDMLKYEHVPDPAPRSGEVRIRVHAATVNRVLDVSLRAGKEPRREPVLPLIPGVDCAGVIDAVGADVTKWKIGDRVAAAGMMPLAPVPEDGEAYTGPIGMMGIKRPGGFAELVCVPARAVVAIPEGLAFTEAAVIMRHAPMAWSLLFNAAQLKENEVVLVMGAGGNLGLAGIQLARNVAGATVIAVAGSDDKLNRAVKVGADHGINYNRQNLYAEVMKITQGKGVDVLYDNVSNPAVLPDAFRTLGMNGRLVTAGAHGGPNVEIDFAHLYQKRITIMGRTGASKLDITNCFAAAAAGKIRGEFERVLPLSAAAEAHRLVETGQVDGKIVLSPVLDVIDDSTQRNHVSTPKDP